jgi:hypothetical protein
VFSLCNTLETLLSHLLSVPVPKPKYASNTLHVM